MRTSLILTLALVPSALMTLLSSPVTATVRPQQDPSAGDPSAQAIYYYLRDVEDAEKDSPEALLQAYMDRHTSRDYAGAVELAFRLIEAVPNQPIGYYNLACSQARLHRYDLACDALEQAIEHGWRNLEHTKIDPDLASIRDQRRYEHLLAKIRRRREGERIIAEPLRTDIWSTVVADLNLQVPSLLERYHVPGVTIALINDREFVWSDAFGTNDAHEKTPMVVDQGFKLRAPAHLFALLAALEQESRGGYRVAALLQQGAAYDRESQIHAARQFEARPRAYVFGVRQPSDSDRRGVARPAAYTDRIQASAPDGWPFYQPRTTNFVLLQTAIEGASEETFYVYCRDNLFQPLFLDETRFIRHDERGERQAVGHTRLGTPIESAVDRSWRTPAVYTTAPDMGRLIEALVEPRESSGSVAIPSQPIDRALGPLATQLHEFGIGVHISRTDDGPCVQLADNIGGTGCLIRWYPDAGKGIIVMFNAETGPDVALRIAHMALGGE